MSVNKCILVGHLGADPETRTSQAGNMVATLKIATNERVKRGDSWEDATEWHRVVCFGRTAENVARFLAKGRQIYIEGRIQTRKWTDRDGNERWTTEIVANDVRFLGGGRGQGQGGYSERRRPSDAPEAEYPGGLDDDIPF